MIYDAMPVPELYVQALAMQLQPLWQSDWAAQVLLQVAHYPPLHLSAIPIINNREEMQEGWVGGSTYITCRHSNFTSPIILLFEVLRTLPSTSTPLMTLLNLQAIDRIRLNIATSAHDGASAGKAPAGCFVEIRAKCCECVGGGAAHCGEEVGVCGCEGGGGAG